MIRILRIETGVTDGPATFADVLRQVYADPRAEFVNGRFPGVVRLVPPDRPTNRFPYLEAVHPTGMREPYVPQALDQFAPSWEVRPSPGALSVGRGPHVRACRPSEGARTEGNAGLTYADVLVLLRQSRLAGMPVRLLARRSFWPGWAHVHIDGAEYPTLTMAYQNGALLPFTPGAMDMFVADWEVHDADGDRVAAEPIGAPNRILAAMMAEGR